MQTNTFYYKSHKRCFKISNLVLKWKPCLVNSKLKSSNMYELFDMREPQL